MKSKLGRVMEIKEIKGIPDYSEIIDLINAEWPSEFGEADDAMKIKEMTKSHNQNTDTVKYLFDNENIIGFYRYSLWPRDNKDTKNAHTFDIAINPNFQKKGFGSLLMRDMIADCKEKGIVKLLSRSFKSNQASIELHKSLGFSLHLENEDSFVWEIAP